jgi:hypothetical protein
MNLILEIILRLAVWLLLAPLLPGVMMHDCVASWQTPVLHGSAGGTHGFGSPVHMPAWQASNSAHWLSASHAGPQ